MPFLDEDSRWLPWSHLCSGTWLYSNTVPTRTVNCFRQWPHFLRPWRTTPSGFVLLGLERTPFNRVDAIDVATMGANRAVGPQNTL